MNMHLATAPEETMKPIPDVPQGQPADNPNRPPPPGAPDQPVDRAPAPASGPTPQSGVPQTMERPGTGNPNAQPSTDVTPIPPRTATDIAEDEAIRRDLMEQARERIHDDEGVYVPPLPGTTSQAGGYREESFGDPQPSTGGPATVSKGLQDFIDDYNTAVQHLAAHDGSHNLWVTIRDEAAKMINIYRSRQGAHGVNWALNEEARETIITQGGGILNAGVNAGVMANANTIASTAADAVQSPVPSMRPLAPGAQGTAAQRLRPAPPEEGGAGTQTPPRTPRNPDLSTGGVRPALPQEPSPGQTLARTPRNPDLNTGGVRPALPPEEGGTGAPTPPRTPRNPDLSTGGVRPALPQEESSGQPPSGSPRNPDLNQGGVRPALGSQDPKVIESLNQELQQVNNRAWQRDAQIGSITRELRANSSLTAEQQSFFKQKTPYEMDAMQADIN